MEVNAVQRASQMTNRTKINFFFLKYNNREQTVSRKVKLIQSDKNVDNKI